MKHAIIFCTLFALFVLTQSAAAQDLVSLYDKAFEAYEDGEFNKSLELIKTIERQGEGSNPRLISLKLLVYKEAGHTDLALRQVYILKQLTADKTGEAYEYLEETERELMEIQGGLKERQLEQLETNRADQLDSIKHRYDSQLDELIYQKALAAGNPYLTAQLMREYPRNTRLAGLRGSYDQVINRESFTALIEKSIFYEDAGALDSAQFFAEKAYALIPDPDLKNQIGELKHLRADQFFLKAHQHYSERNYREAIQELNKAISLKNDGQFKQLLNKVTEENAYQNLFENFAKEKLLAFLKKYPKSSRVPNVEASIIRYNIEEIKRGMEERNVGMTQNAFVDLKKYKHSTVWADYEQEYNMLMEKELALLIKAPKRARMDNGQVILYYLDELSEYSNAYLRKSKSFSRQYRSYTRPNEGYFNVMSTASLSHLGLAGGGLKNRKFGFGFNSMVDLRYVKEEYKSNHLTPSLSSFNLLTTKKIIYPVWLYGGLGYGYLHQVLRDEEQSGMVYFGDEFIHSLNTDVGVVLKLSKAVLNCGLQTPYIPSQIKEAWGLHKNFSYVYFSLGFTL